ncbi:MAG: S8 family serine peptidase [Clostridia bacterium]|nr:S8 family serine peptidase [Clostridia bacterium]
MKKLHSISFVMVLALIFLLMSPAYCVFEKDSDNTVTSESHLIQKEYDNDLNKLHFYFSDVSAVTEKTSAKSASDRTTASVEPSFDYIDDLTELDNAVDNMYKYCDEYLDDNESIQVVVEFDSDYENTEEYADFFEEGSKIKTVDDLRAFKKKVAEFSKEYHRQENEKNISKLENIYYKKMEVIDYAPFVVLEVDEKDIEADTLLDLAEEEAVLNISLSSEEEVESEASWSRTLNAIDVQATVVTGGYTGEGVNIGVLESGGICDKESSYLDDVTIFVDPNCDKKETEHATVITALIASIAPDANFYVSDNLASALSWFIEQGCDVVNCSFGYPNTIENGDVFVYDSSKAIYRYNIDGLYDYQIKANFINVVTSAGNVKNDNTKINYNPYGHITSPGLAYSAITVGGLDCSLGLLGYDLEHDSGSCYVATNNSTKPEVSAIMETTLPWGGDYYYGTSVSAAQVTACIALLCEKDAGFVWYPDMAKATVIGSAKEIDDHTNISNSYFDDETGAGCISYVNMNKAVDRNHIINVNQPNSIISSDTMSLSKNVVLQAGLSWSPQVDIYDNICYITNYDIHVYDPDGNLVCTSTLGSNSTVEFIRYRVKKAGVHTVAVYQNGANPAGTNTDYIAYTLNMMYF